MESKKTESSDITKLIITLAPSDLQIGLDILGSSEIPIVSQLADVGSGFISLSQGDYVGAGLSFGGVFIPGLSQAKLAKTGFKLGTRAARGG